LHLSTKYSTQLFVNQLVCRFSADPKYFGTSAKFWLGLQDDYDLEEEQNQKEEEFNNIKPLEGSAP